METVSQWASGICICCIVVCIVEMLISDTNLEKTVRFVLGAFMLCAVLFPTGELLSGLNENFQTEFPLETQITSELENQKEEYLKGEIEKLVRQTLSDNGVEVLNVTISMDIDESKSISMITAEAVISRKDAFDSQKASRLVRENLGIECRTVIAE